MSNQHEQQVLEITQSRRQHKLKIKSASTQYWTAETLHLYIRDEVHVHTHNLSQAGTISSSPNPS
jgi:hypothetical protein